LDRKLPAKPCSTGAQDAQAEVLSLALPGKRLRIKAYTIIVHMNDTLPIFLPQAYADLPRLAVIAGIHHRLTYHA
jgi:hypothetical protein